MGFFTLKDETHADILADAQKLAADAEESRRSFRELWPEFARLDEVCVAVKKVVQDERYGVTADYIARKLAPKHYQAEEVRAALTLLVSGGNVDTETEDHEAREKRLALAKGFQEEPEELSVWFVPRRGRR